MSRKIEFTERESTIQQKVIKFLKAKYPDAMVWKYHSGGRYGVSGMPDVWMIHAGRTYCLEVKRPGEKLTLLQQKTMDKLSVAGATVAVVHSIEEPLAAIREVEV